MKVLVVIGTRPEAIKMAPVIHALQVPETGCQVSVCATGQHRELLDGVIRLFNIGVDYDLNLMRPGQRVSGVTCAVLKGMESTLEAARPDVVLVHGDTTTSFASALAAYYAKTRIGHVEAGLRTYDKYRPFPEEGNRRLVDALCDYHYAPTVQARENLLREQVAEEGILVTGNTVIDALLDVAKRPYMFDEPVLDVLGKERRLILVTAHRRESFGTPLREMCRAMRELVRRNKDIEIVYPVHPNPEVRRVTNDVLAGEERVLLAPPLDYVPFVHLLKKSVLVLTDSGGLQEEAPALNKPVLVMRDVTERPEAVAAGTAQLVGTEYDGIVNGVQRLLDDDEVYGKMASAPNPFGDGQAAHRIARHLSAIGRA